ncbi:MAG: hypothetical protein ACRES8_04250, partial [Nevskiaceae bacterium]
LAAPTIAQTFPGVDELAVRMRFDDPEGKVKPQPYAQVFSPDMQAFFQFQCPLRDCTGGGFDLTAAVPRGLARKGAVTAGSLVCSGKRKRPHGETSRCDLRLDYEFGVAGKHAHAA